MRFSSTGAGAPHNPFAIGGCGSSSAGMAASISRHCSRAAAISAALQRCGAAGDAAVADVVR